MRKSQHAGTIKRGPEPVPEPDAITVEQKLEAGDLCRRSRTGVRASAAKMVTGFLNQPPITTGSLSLNKSAMAFLASPQDAVTRNVHCYSGQWGPAKSRRLQAPRSDYDQSSRWEIISMKKEFRVINSDTFVETAGHVNTAHSLHAQWLFRMGRNNRRERN